MKVEIADDYLDKLVREALISAYNDCIAYPIYSVPEEDNELLYCLKRVIEHYSSPEDYDNWLKSIEESESLKEDD